MKDYFEELIDDLQRKKITIEWKKVIKDTNKTISNFFDYSLSNEILAIYSQYRVFELNWISKDEKYKGFINFVPYHQIQIEHENLIDTMKNCYDEDEDCLEIKADIMNWYPLFRFPNGDCFCLDIKTGKVVFYEHEVYDSGVNLHGLVIALSVDDLFEKWSKCYFVDIYDWYDGTDENGINIHKSVFKELL